MDDSKPQAPDELKRAVATLRTAGSAVDQANTAAMAAAKRVADLQAQTAQAEQDATAANAAVVAAKKGLDDARSALSAHLKPGVPWSEDGSTVFMLGSDGKFRESALNWLHGRPA